MKNEDGFFDLGWFEESAEERLEKETGNKEMIDWDKIFKISYHDNYGGDVIPIIVQEIQTKDVLILAYANWQAVEQTLKTGLATFWSTSRKKLWVKGEASGNYMEVSEVRVNCEQNSLLYLVKLKNGGGACHVEDEAGNNRKSCFYRRVIYRSDEKLLLEFV